MVKVVVPINLLTYQRVRDIVNIAMSDFQLYLLNTCSL